MGNYQLGREGGARHLTLEKSKRVFISPFFLYWRGKDHIACHRLSSTRMRLEECHCANLFQNRCELLVRSSFFVKSLYWFQKLASCS